MLREMIVNNRFLVYYDAFSQKSHLARVLYAVWLYVCDSEHFASCAVERIWSCVCVWWLSGHSFAEGEPYNSSPSSSHSITDKTLWAAVVAALLLLIVVNHIGGDRGGVAKIDLIEKR